MKIDDNGKIRDMTEKEIEELTQFTPPEFPKDETTERLDRIETGITKILELLSNQ